MTDFATIGHSTHPREHFIGLLARHAVTAVADVRSSPYSRNTPQYDREGLRATLREARVGYVFLGDTLGARSDDPGDYDGARVRYDRIAASQRFRAAVDRLMAGRARHRIALMCAEKEPLACHRTILVARALEAAGARVGHILADGSLEPHGATMARLMAERGIESVDLFAPPAALLDRAYRAQEERIAYRRPAEAAE